MEISKLFKNKKVLITGGLGFIGSNLARSLADIGAQITLVDSLIPEYGGNFYNISGFEDKVKVNISDVRDDHSMKYLVQGQNYLFNLAGQTSHMDSMENPFPDLDINARAQLSILEACRRYNPDIKIVFASTRQIYGKPENLPVSENHPLRPVDVNGINKTAGEWYHLLYNDVYGMRTSVLRLTNTYGPRMRIKDARQTFVGIWIKSVLEGQPFEVWGGEQMRDFTYVDDAVEAFLLAAAREEANGHAFNLGGIRPVSLKQVAALLVEIDENASYSVREYPADRKKIDVGNYYADYSLIRSELGWEPAVPLEKGLTRTLDYYREHLDKYI